MAVLLNISHVLELSHVKTGKQENLVHSSRVPACPLGTVLKAYCKLGRNEVEDPSFVMCQQLFGCAFFWGGGQAVAPCLGIEVMLFLYCFLSTSQKVLDH